MTLQPPRLHSTSTLVHVCLAALFALSNPAASPAQIVSASAFAAGHAQFAAISATGRYVVVLAHEDGGSFLVDLVQHTTTPLGDPLTSGGRTTVSDDGRFVTQGQIQFDRTTGQWTNLGYERLDPPLTHPLPTAYQASAGAVTDVSGRYTAFVSDQRPWDGDCCSMNAYRGLFVRDRETGGTCSFAIPETDFRASKPLFVAPVVGPSGPALWVNPDGSRVVFVAKQANPVPSDPAPIPGVFALDCRRGQVRRVSDANDAAIHGVVTMSPSATVLAYRASATCQAPIELVVRDIDTGVSRSVVPANPDQRCLQYLAVSDDGRFLAYAWYDDGLDVQIVWQDLERGVTKRVDVNPLSGISNGRIDGRVEMSADGRFVAFASTASNLGAGDTDSCGDPLGPCFDVFVRDMFDDDGDTMDDTWESSFGLNPLDPADAMLDADGDGATNVQEFAAHAHPRGLASATRYFAEGATSSLFETRFSVANPGATDAMVVLRYLKADATVASSVVQVPAMQSRKVTVSQEPGMVPAEFSTVVESDQPVVADRVMWWSADTAYGTSGERAVAAPASRWFLAEGATHSGFNLFYLLQNPGLVEAQVRVRYLLPSGSPLEKTYTVAGRSRYNIWVNLEEFPSAPGQAPLASTDVSADIEVISGPGIVVERAMYLTRSATSPGGLFEAGHESAGVTTTASSWYFAEGATGDLFDLFVLIANPSSSEARVRATYFLENGATYSRDYTIGANSRYNIWVDFEEFDGIAGLPLAQAGAVATRLEVINGVPIVAERSMWWPGPTASTWSEAHNSPGATVTSTRWVVADGAVLDVPAPTDTYYLIANPGDTDAVVKVTILFADGAASVSDDFHVGARSRFNVDVRSAFPMSVGRGFGAVIESLGSGAAPVVVEWAIYNDALGRAWAGGANALATPMVTPNPE